MSELRQELISMLELIEQILGAVERLNANMIYVISNFFACHVITVMHLICIHNNFVYIFPIPCKVELSVDNRYVF